MANSDNLVGSILGILNDSSKMTDFYNGTRIGSYFFGPNQELTFNKYMPKGYVDIGTKTPKDKSFGTGFKHDNSHTINITYFVRQGEVGSGTTKKNRSLLYHVVDVIESSLKNNATENFSFIDVGETIPGFFDEENSMFWITLPCIYMERS